MSVRPAQSARSKHRTTNDHSHLEIDPHDVLEVLSAATRVKQISNEYGMTISLSEMKKKSSIW
jgi:hypothetical protein